MSIQTCPHCAASMREIRRSRVALDICTSCRGVWLDPGELETLVNNIIAERAVQQAKLADARQDRRRREDDDEDESVVELVFNLLK